MAGRRRRCSAVLLAALAWIGYAVEPCPATMQEMQVFSSQAKAYRNKVYKQYAQDWKATRSLKAAFFLAVLKKDDPETAARLYAKVLREFPDCVHAGMHRGKALLQTAAHTAAEEHFDKTFEKWSFRQDLQIPLDFFAEYHAATMTAARNRSEGPGNISATRWHRIITWPGWAKEQACFLASQAAQAYVDYLFSFGLVPQLPRHACRDLPGCDESYKLQGEILRLCNCDICWEMLGTLSIYSGDVETSFRYYQQNVKSMRHIDASPENSLSRKKHLEARGRVTSKQRLDHDADQLEFLVAKGMLPKQKYQTWVEKFRALAKELPDFEQTVLPDETLQAIDPMYGRLHYMANGDRLPGQVLAQRDPSEWAEFEAAFANGHVVVIDNILTEEALQHVRHFAVHSTIYFDTKATGGYEGSYADDAFGAPIIVQIAAELGAALPEATQRQNVTQAWAYKYENKKNAGIRLHADRAVVNCNLWLTPDDANMLKDRGGLDIYTKKVPFEWGFDHYNTAAGYQDMLAFIEDAELVRVPYRENRVVCFNSQYLHKTDDIDFKPGYENRRINFTLLYGDKYTPAQAYELAKAAWLEKNPDRHWPESRQEL